MSRRSIEPGRAREVQTVPAHRTGYHGNHQLLPKPNHCTTAQHNSIDVEAGQSAVYRSPERSLG